VSSKHLLVLLLAVLLACGSPTDVTETTQETPAEAASTAGPEEATAGETGVDGSAGLDAVYAQLEGLEGDEREARLVELAQAEEGELSLYTAMTLDDANPLIDEFESMYDLSVSIYRAVADTVAARYSQEVAAGFPGADLIGMNAAPLIGLDNDGLLLPLNTPTTANLTESRVFDNWASTWLNVYTAAWNTDLVSPDRAPSSWEEVLAFDGVAAWEPRDWDWMGTLVLDHFMAEKGMTEEEAIDLFRQGAQDVQAINGHTAMLEFLAAGELEMVASAYLDTVTQFMGNGVPLEWQPAVEPLIALPDGIAITQNTQRPASALLFIDFMMTRGQEVLVEVGRIPASPNVEGGIPSDVDVIGVNFGVIEDRDKWDGIMQEIIQG